MKEFIEKLIGRLEEERKKYTSEYGLIDIQVQEVFVNVRKIVKELAEEYNNGWIPCSERLPEMNKYVLCQGNHSQFIACIDSIDNKWRDTHYYTRTTIKAWQPLPQPYKEGSADNA